MIKISARVIDKIDFTKESFFIIERKFNIPNKLGIFAVHLMDNFVKVDNFVIVRVPNRPLPEDAENIRNC